MLEAPGQHGTPPKVRTFYQIWKQPLMTVGGAQVISDAIRLCGGENVFADLKSPATWTRRVPSGSTTGVSGAA